ncbi:DDE family endonuclease [Leptospira santarosai]|uniref:DDE family endonuclease n=1 Tax=Leptospira santarosai TaxID=28183 RepID=A0A2P1QYJ2_9LEPT|nr:DDE family endonuclease [Leptospira santarosai]
MQLLKENHKKILIVWDNLFVRKSKVVKEFLKENEKRLRVEFLPPYAPELNPWEYIWCRWKRNYMANFCLENLSSLIKRTKSTTSSFKTYWKRSKLEYRYRDDNTSFVAIHRVRPVKAPLWAFVFGCHRRPFVWF